MLPDELTNYYNQNAKQLFAKYQSMSPDRMYANWKQYLPVKPGLALDVGGGSGRDALWLARKGWEVIAVEPASVLRGLAQKSTKDYSVTWLNDSLPKLLTIQEYRKKFSLILVNGVMMHISPQDRANSFKTLIDLLDEEALLVITLRQGPDSEGRGFYPVQADEIVQFAQEESMQVQVSNTQADELKRDGVSWQTVIIMNMVIQ